MSGLILTLDGDTPLLIVKTPITASDPADEFSYLSQAYRIVADRAYGTLVLVPLSPKAIRVATSEVEQYLAAQDRNRAQREDLDPDHVGYVSSEPYTDAEPLWEPL